MDKSTKLDKGPEMEKRRIRFGSFLKGILIGSFIAAGIALFTAPHSGSETRLLLREKGEQMRDRSMQTIDDARQQISSKLSDIRQRDDKIVKHAAERMGVQAGQD